MSDAKDNAEQQELVDRAWSHAQRMKRLRQAYLKADVMEILEDRLKEIAGYDSAMPAELKKEEKDAAQKIDKP
jgi:hypothetical protein